MFEAREAIVMPHQTLLNLNARLDKPNYDTRDVVKTPIVYRLTVGADEETREWELPRAEDLDTARPELVPQHC